MDVLSAQVADLYAKAAGGAALNEDQQAKV
jgi:hypothetical protein